MIVLDEQLDDPQLSRTIDRWYKGQVINIKQMRPYTVILDDAVESLLLRLKQPTFVTINYTDFWKVIPAHQGYCVVCLKLSVERFWDVPDRLRKILRLPEFNTKAKRMGKVISVTDSQVSFYE